MTVEFHHLKSAGFIETDFVIINGNRLTYDKLTSEQIECIFLLLEKADYARAYMVMWFKRGIKSHLELIRLTARRFFPLLNNVYDIDENGTLHPEKL